MRSCGVPRTTGPRSGTLLIIIAGCSALLATLAIAFLVRERNSAEEIAQFQREVQARIMLVAACDYVLEGSRIGYDIPPDPLHIGSDPTINHVEAFGWIDVRQPVTDAAGKVTGPLIGPNTRGAKATDIVPLFNATPVEDSDGDGVMDRPAWPAIGGVARCPMYEMKRPPFAIQLAAAYNPINTDPSNPIFGLPYLSHPDPQPQAASRSEYFSADPTPVGNSADLAWFRVYRDGPATFVVTCGAGATQGFRDWNEVRGAGTQARQRFNDDQAFFNSLLDAEVRFWYRIEWNAAVASPAVHNIKNAWDQGSEDHFVSYSVNVSESTINPRSQSMPKNMGGTIRWIERLRYAPTLW